MTGFRGQKHYEKLTRVTLEDGKVPAMSGRMSLGGERHAKNPSSRNIVELLVVGTMRGHHNDPRGGGIGACESRVSVTVGSWNLIAVDFPTEVRQAYKQ